MKSVSPLKLKSEKLYTLSTDEEVVLKEKLAAAFEDVVESKLVPKLEDEIRNL